MGCRPLVGLTHRVSTRITAARARAFQLTMARPAAPVGLPFADVSSSDWFYNDVRYVYEKGIMDGTGADRFSPNAPLTRAMIVTILYRMAGSPSVSGSSDFTDVAAGKWFAKAVAWAAANGIVNGYGSGLFGPNDPVTREQLAAILYRYAVYGGMTAVTLEENLGGFADTAQLSAYAIQAMNWAVGQGLIEGSNGLLRPQANASRAEVAAISSAEFPNGTKLPRRVFRRGSPPSFKNCAS